MEGNILTIKGFMALHNAETLEQLEDEQRKLEEQIRDHVRSIESRIVMSQKEEVAREAMILWLEEELERIEAKIAALLKQKN